MSADSNDHKGGYPAGDTPASELKPPPENMRAPGNVRKLASRRDEDSDPHARHSTRMCAPSWCGHPVQRDGGPFRIHDPRAAKALLDFAEEETARRVVLVKPGDVLVIGNLGEAFAGQVELLQEATIKMKVATGISILACYQDVTISTTSAALLDVLDWLGEQSELETSSDARHMLSKTIERIHQAVTGGPGR